MAAVIAIGACSRSHSGSLDAPPRSSLLGQGTVSLGAENPSSAIKTLQSPNPESKLIDESAPDSPPDCRDADGCLDLARRWDRGRGGPRDTQRARRYYAMACEGGSPVACNSLGAMIMREEGQAQSLKLAFSLFNEACRGDNPAGCYNAGVCYEWGNGVEQNFTAALSSHEKACARGMAGACRRVAALRKWNWDFALLRGRPRSDAQSAEP